MTSKGSTEPSGQRTMASGDAPMGGRPSGSARRSSGSSASRGCRPASSTVALRAPKKLRAARMEVASCTLPHAHAHLAHRGRQPTLAVERLLATGFLSLGPKVLAEPDKEKMQIDIVDEQLDVMGLAFLGQTIGCARCHDHKFDPIPTSDYYALALMFQLEEGFTYAVSMLVMLIFANVMQATATLIVQNEGVMATIAAAFGLKPLIDGFNIIFGDAEGRGRYDPKFNFAISRIIETGFESVPQVRRLSALLR